MKKLVLLSALMISFACNTVYAKQSAITIPALLKSGFDNYEKEGPKAAIEAWSKGSAVEASKEALAQANNFRQVEDFYGKYIGYDVVKVNQISSVSSVYLIDIKYEKGGLFGKFFLYKKPNGDFVVTTFNFHTNAEAVWPNSTVFGCEK